MNRRSFLAFAGLAPLAPKALAAPAPKPVLSGIAAWLPTTAPTGPFFGIDRGVDVSYSLRAARWEAMQVSYAEAILDVARKQFGYTGPATIITEDVRL